MVSVGMPPIISDTAMVLPLVMSMVRRKVTVKVGYVVRTVGISLPTCVSSYGVFPHVRMVNRPSSSSVPVFAVLWCTWVLVTYGDTTPTTV